MTLTPAARQIEQALEQGYEVVAFNLYRDALRQEIKLVEEEDVPNADSIEWHRSIQERVGWKTAAKEAEKTWNIGTLIQSETLPRDEDGVWTGRPS